MISEELMQRCIQAEDDFILKFGNKEKLENGEFYYWDKSENWPKFNFLRCERAHDLSKPLIFSEGEQEKLEFLKKNNKDVSIRVNLESIPNKLHPSLERRGNPISHIRLGKPTPWAKQTKLKLKLCETIEEIQHWWDIHTNDTPMEELPVSSAVVLRMFDDDLDEFYLLWDENRPVHSVCATVHEEFINLWGAATKTSDRKKGYYRASINLFRELYPNHDIHAQVNLDSHGFNALKSITGFDVIFTEARVVLI